MSQLEIDQQSDGSRTFVDQERRYCYPRPRSSSPLPHSTLILLCSGSLTIGYVVSFFSVRLSDSGQQLVTAGFIIVLGLFLRYFPPPQFAARNDKNCARVRYFPELDKKLPFLDSGQFSLAADTIRFDGNVSFFEFGRNDVSKIYQDKHGLHIELIGTGKMPPQTVRISGPGPFEQRGLSLNEFYSELKQISGDPVVSIFPPIFPYYLAGVRAENVAYSFYQFGFSGCYFLGSAIMFNFSFSSALVFYFMIWFPFFIPSSWDHYMNRWLIKAKAKLRSWGFSRSVIENMEQNMIRARDKKRGEIERL